MGTSTDGQICFGVMFEEDYEFPWNAEQYDDDIEAWWRDVHGYKNPAPNPFTEEGEYNDGFSSGDPRVSEYFDRQRDWMKKNPVPVTEVNYCSGDCPMIIIAVPSTVKTNNRGYPLEFSPSLLTVRVKEVKMLRDFCTKYGLAEDCTPKWWLSSYWG